MPTYPQRSLAAQRAIRERRTFRTRGNLSARPGYSFDAYAGRIHRWFRDAIEAAIADGLQVAYTVFSYATPIAVYVNRETAPVDAGRWIVDTVSHSTSSGMALGQARAALGGYGWESRSVGLDWDPIPYLDAAAEVHRYNALTDPQKYALVAVATGNPTANHPGAVVLRNLMLKGLLLSAIPLPGRSSESPWARKLVVTADAARMLRACGFTVNSTQEA